MHNLAVTGLIVFTVFLGSTAGQLLTGRIGVRRALPVGCLVLVVGLLLVATSLALTALPSWSSARCAAASARGSPSAPV